MQLRSTETVFVSSRYKENKITFNCEVINGGRETCKKHH